MPVETRIDKEAGLIVYEATGAIGFDDMRRAFESIFSHPDFQSGMNALCHAKNASLKVSVAEIQQLIALLGQHSEKRGKGFRVALLVKSNEDFGLSSLFELGAHSLPFEVKIFRNTAEAHGWLGVKAS